MATQEFVNSDSLRHILEPIMGSCHIILKEEVFIFPVLAK